MRYLQRGLTLNEKGATPGFTLFCPIYAGSAELLNMQGEVVHAWPLPARATNYAYLLPTGNLLLASRLENGIPDMQSGGNIQEFDWDGNVVWQYQDPYQHHDFRRCANGNTMYLGWELLTPENQARVQGGQPGSEHSQGIWGDYIREVTPAGETAWEWHAQEHMEIEKYPLAPDSNRHEFAHPNAIMPLENGDALICFRHIDVVAIVDRATGKFSWERYESDWGGPHDMQMLENGNMMIFANRRNKMPRGSKVIEFDKDSGETIWEYQGNPSHTFDSPFISGAQRLWSGNTLICEGLWGRFFEVKPDGEVVWEYVSPHTFERRGAGVSTGEVSFVFRAYRYAPDGPEIQGRLNGKLG